MQANVDYKALKGAFLKGRVAVVSGTGTLAGAVAETLTGFGAVAVSPQPGERPDALVGRAASTYGKIDALVNCPSLAPDKVLLDSSEADWRAVFDNVLVAAVAACRAAVPLMLANGYGRIVNLASVSGKMGLDPYGAHVAAAAAGLHGLTKSLAREFAGRGIAANTVSPGLFAEDLARAPALEKYIGWSSIQRPCEPAEAAKAVAFMCSEQAEFFTGCCLDVNGGLYLD